MIAASAGGLRIARRKVLIAMLAGGTTACAGGSLIAETQRPLGLASLTVARELAVDYAGTLRHAKAFGYSHFGFPLGPQSPRHPVPRDPVEVAALCRAAGLSVGVVRLAHTDDYSRQMKMAAGIGASIVAQSAADVFFTGAVPGQTTRSAFEGWMEKLALMSRAAREEGLRLVYHNHDWDHVPLNGKTPLELIAASFALGEVDFEIDLGWASVAGVDPLTLIRDLGPRVLSLHLKDVDRDCDGEDCRRFVAPGEGNMGYGALMPRLDAITDAVSYVEVDDPVDGLNAAATGAATVLRARDST